MLTTTGCMTTLYITLQKSARQRLAWRWWYRQQAVRLHNSAESIRNGLLQRTFALRRQLESTAAESAAESQSVNALAPSQWLDDVQAIYRSLELLSDDLLPPFLLDNLPLAFNFAVQARQYAPPSLRLDLELPTHWPNDDTEPDTAYRHQMLLSIFVELLMLLIDKRESAQRLKIVLRGHSALRSLSIEIEDSNPIALRRAARRREVQYLKEIFKTLSNGQLKLEHRESLLMVQMRWCDP